MQQQKINTIIFDLDGTLVNSIDDLTDNVNRVLGAEGYPKRSLEEVKSFVGNGIPILMERSLPQGTPQEEVLRCLKIFTVYYLHNMHNKTQPYEGIVPVLEELKKRNIKTGVVSNKLDEATKKMCSHYFPHLIDAAIGDTEHRKKKPCADNVLEAMDILQAKRETTLYVGDTKVDVETARNSGLPILGASWGYRGRKKLEKAGPDFIIDTPFEILTWLDGKIASNTKVD